MRKLLSLLVLLWALPVCAQELNPGGGNVILGPPPNAVFNPGPVSITGNSNNGSDQISNVNVNGVLNALSFAGADIGVKVNAAVTQLGSAGGTVFIPAGNYHFTTPMAFNKTNCNVTIAGDSQAGTVLWPQFSNADVISFIDSASENPPTLCKGGVRDIRFESPWNTGPTNLNLIHIENMVGLDLQNIYAYQFNAGGNTTIDLDEGAGPANTTFTEGIYMRNIVSRYSDYMIKFDARGLNGSENNNILKDSHCDTNFTTGSSCLRFVNDPGGSTHEGNHLEFDGNINAAGTSAISFDSSSGGGSLNGGELNFLVQNYPGSYCFSKDTGPTMPVAPRGSAYCLNANNNVLPWWQDKTRIHNVFIPTTSAVPAATLYGSYQPTYYHATSVVIAMSAYATTTGVGCTTPPVIDLACNGADQVGYGVTLGNGVLFTSYVPLNVLPAGSHLPIACANTSAISAVVNTAAAGCTTFPANISIAFELSEGTPNQ